MALYYSATEVVPIQSQTSQRTFASSWIGNAATAAEAQQTATNRITQANSDLPLARVSSTIHKIDDAMIRQAANSRNESIYITTATFRDGSAKAMAFVATPETKATAERKVMETWAKEHEARGYGGVGYEAPWRSTSTMQVDRSKVIQAAQEIDRRDKVAQIQAEKPQLDVAKFSRSVIDTYQRATQNAGDVSFGRNAAIYTAAQRAADDKTATLGDAARVANATIRQYEQARAQGQDHRTARDQVAQAMAQRYDAQGRDTQRRERQLSQGMSR